MMVIYRYRKERYFARPPAAIWPFVSDTARLWELNGNAPFEFEERVDAQGRVRRFARGKLGPIPVRWEEDFGEWQENRHFRHVREYQNGPMRRFEWGCELFAEREGWLLILTGMVRPPVFWGFVGRHAGIIDAEFARPLAAIDRLVRESEDPAHVPGSSAKDLVEPGARRRLGALVDELARDPVSHGLAQNLSDFLRACPVGRHRSIRPIALAKIWSVRPDHAVELFLAAARSGIVAMGWDLLCPRCRGAKSRVSRLYELPKGAHCSSCNIDYERNFSRNVELTFHPEAWVRPLPDGEMCMLGQGTARHIKFQAEVAAGLAKSFELSLAPGPTVFGQSRQALKSMARSGPTASSCSTSGGARPDDRLEEAGCRDELQSATRAAGRWRSSSRIASAQDALSGARVIAMPVFRRLCPEQLLRPGDNAGYIGLDRNHVYRPDGLD